MKKLITLASLFFITVSGIAQADDVDYSKKELIRKTATGKVSASLFMYTGMGFQCSKPASTGITTYIAPVISYRFTQKFKLNFAFIHDDFNGNSFMNRRVAEQPQAHNVHYSGNSIQLGGQYLLTEKTMISGAVLYGLSSKRYDYKGAALGIDYKVTPHSTISVKASLIQGNGYNYSPYSNYPFGSNRMIPMGIQPSLFNTSPVNF